MFYFLLLDLESMESMQETFWNIENFLGVSDKWSLSICSEPKIDPKDTYYNLQAILEVIMTIDNLYGPDCSIVVHTLSYLKTKLFHLPCDVTVNAPTSSTGNPVFDSRRRHGFLESAL